MAPPRICLKLPPVEVGAHLSLVGSFGWGPRDCSEVRGCFSLSPGTQGHSPPLVCFTCTFAGAVCCHLIPPLSPGSVTGNTGCLPGPRRPSAQSPGHKYSAQALLALCPTGEGAIAYTSFYLPRKADYARLAGAGKGASEETLGLTCR